MFKFLKEKIKSSIQRISKKIEEEGATEESNEQKSVEPLEQAEEQQKQPEIKKEQIEEIKENEVRFDVDDLLEEIEKESQLEKELQVKEEVKPESTEEIIEVGLEKEYGIEEEIIQPEQEEIKEGELKEAVVEEEKEAQKTEVQAEDVKKQEEEKEETEKKGFFSKLKEKLMHKEEKKKEIKETEQGQIVKKIVDEYKGKPKEAEKPPILAVEEEKIKTEETEPEEKKGFFSKLKEKIETKKISESQFDELFWELETALLENNVALEVIEKIKADLKDRIVEKPIKRSQIENIIEDSLKDSIMGLFENGDLDLIKRISEKKEKPFVMAFVGINGSGKTTTIAKIAHFLKNNNISCVLAAADTFRAASIEQLQRHADFIGVKLIKHDYGSDPAAVAFDAIKHAKSKNIDVVLIDTAGRMHSNTNLIDEMKKIIRVANPDLKLFVGEAITGNDCVEQAKTFNESINIDGIILAKADVDEKGGAAVSVSYVTKKPIIYLGTGQEYGDLELFNKEKVLESLGL